MQADLTHLHQEMAKINLGRKATRKRPNRKTGKKNKPQNLCGSRVSLVTRRGFEPRTHCLKGSCSAG